MIRRDYILRMLEEFLEVLSRIRALKKGQHWREAATAMDAELERLLGSGAEQIVRLSDTELLARLIKSEPAQATREKALMVAAVLKEAGDVAEAQQKEGTPFYLKGLHLLLEVLVEGDIPEAPEFMPRIDEVAAALGTATVPVETQARLMQHFERTGEFAKAEDRLYAIADAEPEHPGLRDFGLAFYDRLRGKSDDALAGGNLPRSELEAGAAEWRTRCRAAAAL